MSNGRPFGNNPVASLYRNQGNEWRGVKQVAAQAGCSADVAAQRLHRNFSEGLMERRVKARGRGFEYRFLPRVSLDPRQTLPTLEPRITEMYLEKMPVYKIAQELNIRYGTLRRYISDWGLPEIRRLHYAD